MQRHTLTLAAAFLILAGCTPEAGESTSKGEWELLVEQAPFAPRDTAQGFVFDGDIWLSNGWSHGGIKHRDLWRSSDGRAWRRVLDWTPYDPYSQIVEFRGRLFAVNNSVWVSDDGRDWRRILNETPFADDRAEGALFVVDDRMHFLGPTSVWTSHDGFEWEALSEQAPYGPRYGYGAMFFRGKFWVLGGFSYVPNDPPEKRNPDRTSLNDIWWSADGREWKQATASWPPRIFNAAVVHKDRAYLIAGEDNVNGHNLDEVWVSEDGLDWTELQVETRISPPRHWPTLYSFDDRLIVTSGNAWPVVNDVWELHVTE